jgi:hypothetical protein
MTISSCPVPVGNDPAGDQHDGGDASPQTVAALISCVMEVLLIFNLTRYSLARFGDAWRHDDNARPSPSADFTRLYVADATFSDASDHSYVRFIWVTFFESAYRVTRLSDWTDLESNNGFRRPFLVVHMCAFPRAVLGWVFTRA